MPDVIHGDLFDVLPTYPADCFDACVTDPPYGLEFMGKEWDTLGQAGGGFSTPGIGERDTDWPSFSATSRFGAANPTCGVCGGRLRGAKKCTCADPQWRPIGKRRDPANDGLPDDRTGGGMARHLSAMQQWHERWAREVYRVLKPGAHLVVFGGTRTHHRLMCGIEEAGFEIRDTLCWLYGTGFPKSLNVSKATNKAARGEDAGPWQGWGTALKPAYEPIVLARKPLTGTVAQTVQRYGTGALHVDACRIEAQGGRPARVSERRDDLGTVYQSNAYAGRMNESLQPGSRATGTTDLGRWPANVVLDRDSAELLDDQTGHLPAGVAHGQYASAGRVYGGGTGLVATGGKGAALVGYGDTGGASRFFYCAKASRAERTDGNTHPTVKPLALLRWLIRLTTQAGAQILDPFAGSGSTALACRMEPGDRTCTAIEQDAAYVQIARDRLASPVHEAEPQNGHPSLADRLRTVEQQHARLTALLRTLHAELAD
jgi:site-specific DNA-methyltransferase (adenine-specific)